MSIPEREAWLHEHSEAMQSLKRGIADVEEGRIEPLPADFFDDLDDDSSSGG